MITTARWIRRPRRKKTMVYLRMGVPLTGNVKEKVLCISHEFRKWIAVWEVKIRAFSIIGKMKDHRVP